MPVEMSVNVTATHKQLKGQVGTIRSLERLAIQPWGRMEGMPHTIKIRIPDATVEQVVHYKESVKNTFTYDLLNSNAQGRRYKIGINPKVIELFGTDWGVKQEVRFYLVDTWGASVVSFDPVLMTAVFDIPNCDWDALKAGARDIFDAGISNRYLIDEAAVDAVVAAGGWIERTKAQVLANVVDRLA